MQDYQGLIVWQKAHALVMRVYRATRSFPAEERYGLTAQLRRSAVSIPSNIAEGSARGSDAEFARFLNVAAGSAAELDYQLLLARDLTYVSPPIHAELAGPLSEVRRMLTAFIAKLKAKS